MKRRVLFLFPTFLFVLFCLSKICFFCFAETVYLKNGTKVEGMIQELTGEDLAIDVGGVLLRYDLADIKRVDILGKGQTQEDVIDFIEAINLMIADDLRDEGQKETEVMDLRLDNKPWHGYLISEEARDLVVRHRQQMDLIRVPPLCVNLKKLYIHWMLLRENKHNAFSQGDWDEAEKFEKQIITCVDKIHVELDRVRWLLGDQRACGSREYIFKPLSEQVEIQPQGQVLGQKEKGPVLDR